MHWWHRLHRSLWWSRPLSTRRRRRRQWGLAATVWKWRLHHRHRLHAPIHERRCRWHLTWVAHWHPHHLLIRHHRTLRNLLFSSRGLVALGAPRPRLPSRSFGPTVAMWVPMCTLLLPHLIALPVIRILLLIFLPVLRVFRSMDVCPVDNKVPWHIARRAMKR